jgi:dimeric dUTPase (all-alpha-NTP-PPase superfamily)
VISQSTAQPIEIVVDLMDKMQEIWDMQMALNKRIGVDPENVSGEDRRNWVMKYKSALDVEYGELLESIGYKWWRPYEAQDVDMQNAKVEVVDMLHFFISMAQMMGMTAEETHRIYMEKNKVNHERQDSGYFIKDEDDCKHIS